MAKKQGLGRGLGAIFEDNNTERSESGVTKLKISSVEPNFDQPRKTFENEMLSELAESISVHGVLQPILVRESAPEHYEIIAGERRWRASRLAGLTEIPAIVIDASELESAQISLIENIQRENLNPFEEALAYDKLMSGYGMSQEEVAVKLGKSRSAVANAVRLLDLPKQVTDYVKNGTISAGHARTLLGLCDRSKIPAVADKIISKGLSVRETEALVKSENKNNGKSKKKDNAPDTSFVDYSAQIENWVRENIGRSVTLTNVKKKHVLQIEYSDNDDLEELLGQICGKTPEF